MTGPAHMPRRGFRPSWLVWPLGLALAGGFFGGLLWFTGQLPSVVPPSSGRTDAIVVLTGGSGRLHQGLDLLAQGQAKKLFVSGVYRGVEVDELLSLARRAPENLACCIVLGYEADDTHGNAVETAAWIRESNYRSLRLVTSAYHMPRSLLEFRRALPDVEIVPHPVFSERFREYGWWRSWGSVKLVLAEYVKYLMALARGGLAGAAGVPQG
jgi:uncharacterized SAM-binding protein YcdF (DUF218 family)